MNPIYPTKDEILAYIKKNPPPWEQILTLKTWRISHYSKKWSKSTEEQRRHSLEVLIALIWDTHPISKRPKVIPTSIYQQPPTIEWGKRWCYNPNTHTITGDINSLSIISALHETGHSLGGDEFMACGFSVGLFKMCFVKEFSQLQWHGHMLKRINS